MMKGKPSGKKAEILRKSRKAAGLVGNNALSSIQATIPQQMGDAVKGQNRH